MGPAARSTRRRPHIGQRVRRQGETRRTPTWKRRERLSPVRNTSGFSSAPVPRRSKENAGGGRCESKRSDGNWIGFGLDKSNIADSRHVVIQIKRRPGRRYISEVLEINSYDADGDPFDYCAIYQR